MGFPILESSILRNSLLDEDAQFFLKDFSFSFFNIYWRKKSGKKVLLHRMGSILSRQRREFLLSKVDTLNFEFLLNKEWVLEGLENFDILKKLNGQRPIDLPEVDKWRVDFINWLSPYLWNIDIPSVSYMDLISFMLLSLKRKGEEFAIFDFLSGFPLELQVQNIMNSSILCLFLLIIGYQDEEFLSDIFIVSLLNDYQFCEVMWSDQDISLLRKLKETGGKELSLRERKYFQDFYFERLERGREVISKVLKNKRLANYLMWGFETSSGDGPVKGLHPSELADFETLFLVMMKLQKKRNLEDHIKGDLIDIFSQEKNFMTLRARKLVYSSFQFASENDNNFMEIIGL